MDVQHIEERVTKVISALLKQPVTITTKREGIANWDSLKHVEIIFALEEEFDLMFEEEAIGELNTIASIVERIGQYASV